MYKLLSTARKDVIPMAQRVNRLETRLMFIANALTESTDGDDMQADLYHQFTSLAMPGHAAGAWATLEQNDSQRLSFRKLREITLCKPFDHPELRDFVLDIGHLGRLSHITAIGQQRGERYS